MLEGEYKPELVPVTVRSTRTRYLVAPRLLVPNADVYAILDISWSHDCK